MKAKAIGNPLREDSLNIFDMLMHSELVMTKSEAVRMVKQRAVKVDDVTVDESFKADFSDGILNIKVGKRREANVVVS